MLMFTVKRRRWDQMGGETPTAPPSGGTTPKKAKGTSWDQAEVSFIIPSFCFA